MGPRLVPSLERVAQWDGALALKLNRAARGTWTRAFFCAISRLGDGVFWYGLMLWLLVELGADAAGPVAHMIMAGLACTVLYKCLKRWASRARPYETYPEVTLFTAPLDRFSFPSGHTLHAIAFALVALAYFPWLAWLVVPFAALVAVSRVMLGLHYPSDVLAGALVGAAVAAGSFLLLASGAAPL